MLGGTDFIASQAVHNRRVRQAEAATPAITTKAPAPAEEPITITPRSPGIPPERFHKWGSLYVTVSNLHLIGQDPDIDPAFAHTIMDGYAKAIALYNAYIAAFPTRTYVRVTVHVHGGFYLEECVFDHPNVDVVGVSGMPIIALDLQNSGVHAAVTIADSCTQILFKNFDIYNYGNLEGVDWQANLGLLVEEGNEVGIQYSSIRLENINLTGSGTQAYIQRRVLGINYNSKSYDNLTGIWNFEASTVIRYCVGGGDVQPQRAWSDFFNSRFEGENSTTSIIDKGKAIAIWALEDDLTTWVSNEDTIESSDTTHTLSRTGVNFVDCSVIGWTQNKGWVYRWYGGPITRGKKVNSTTGDCHHFCVINSDVFGGVSAYSWFIECAASVNYLVNVEEDVTAIGPAAAFGVVRLFHVNHNTPGGGTVVPSGSCIVDNLFGGAFVPNVSAWGYKCVTHSNFYYFKAGVETAVLADCSVPPAPVGAKAAYIAGLVDFYNKVLP